MGIDEYPVRDRAFRPSAADLEASRDRTVPATMPPPGVALRVLFCGINPGLWTAATGWHFARPGNRFWPALHGAGFTATLLHPSEQDVLAAAGYGITNLVARPTARADELSNAELVEGGRRLVELVAATRPALVAVVGVERVPGRVRRTPRRRSGRRTGASATRPSGYCRTPAA